MAIEVAENGNGKEKTFYCKCNDCASGLNYRLEDVKSQNYCSTNIKEKYITCPICGSKVDVYLLTKEEWDKHSNYPFYSAGCCSGFLGAETDTTEEVNNA